MCFKGVTSKNNTFDWVIVRPSGFDILWICNSIKKYIFPDSVLYGNLRRKKIRNGQVKFSKKNCFGQNVRLEKLAFNTFGII